VRNTTSFDYLLNSDQNGLFIFVIEGSLKLNNERLNRRDSISILPGDSPIIIESETGSSLLFIEVPML
jgi:redox-sensitive bicupin YhaK (pirin superfamily)